MGRSTSARLSVGAVTDVAVQDPSSRGDLDIAEKAIDRIAGHAASQVAGVVSSSATLDKIPGRRLPRVSSTVRGSQASIQVEIAVAWPLPLSAVAGEVRSVVSDTVARLAGLTVVSVDVSVNRTERASKAHSRRVE